jgi:hypothetical protein
VIQSRLLRRWNNPATSSAGRLWLHLDERAT